MAASCDQNNCIEQMHEIGQVREIGQTNDNGQAQEIGQAHVNKKTVVVGISGGVDSAVAAYLLKQQGYNVIGAIMINDRSMDISDAVEVAKGLEIELVTVDMADDFGRNVIDNFVSEYVRGRTPNPCVRCNRYMKWAALEKVRGERNADYIATGHYAKKVRLDNGRYSLRRNETGKDQTYALCMLTQEQLAHTIMPLSDYSKEEIRAIAKTAGIVVADKADSQDICFIPDNDHARFITDYMNDPQCVLASDSVASGALASGNFVDEDGNVLGRHKGLIHYTIGQRKGLNLSLGRPVFVKALRPDTNEVVISTDGDVFGDHLICKDMNMIAVDVPEAGKSLIAKIRYADKGTPCRILSVYYDSSVGQGVSDRTGTEVSGANLSEGQNVGDSTATEVSCGNVGGCCMNETGLYKCRVEFERPVRAITPGQSIVFYDDDVLYASGMIE